MIDALIQGRLHGAPQQRTSAAGKPFVTAKVRVPVSNAEAIFVSVIAFAAPVQAALMALGEGDALSLSGELTPKGWIDREGNAHAALDFLAHAAISPYHVSRKREAVKG